jgi:bifunctional DNA-binding transcriptional regulator/antitoxin component of YhaV-PrlF toxin-antitoxin module
MMRIARVNTIKSCPMTVLQRAVDATVSNDGEITLPPDILRQLGWLAGTRLMVSAMDPDTLIVARRSENPAQYFAGKLGHLFGDHDEIMAHLEELRGEWDEEGNRDDR